MKTKIVSFYADLDRSTYYSDHAELLKETCIGFNISHDIVKLESRGSYMLNCLAKPQFIKDMMVKHNCPLIWMDCDTMLKEPFTVFDDITEDIGFATHTGCISGIKASPIFFNNTNNFTLIIDEWISACEEGLRSNSVELDHDALKHVVLPKIHKDISIFLIKENYNDYCDGKYIKNGNSHVIGKQEIHRKISKINNRRPSL
jgi:hypothetical protein